MTKRQKRDLFRILLAGALLVLAALLPLEGWPRVAAFLLPYLVAGWDVLKNALVHLFQGQVFDENFLMSIATIGAFFTGELPEAVAVMLFYQIGELFQSLAVQRSRRSIAALMDIRPDHANLLRDGEWITADPEAVQPGDRIRIQPGERVPLDGRVLSGSGTLDTSALTGESLPREIGPGDEIISGCVNISGLLEVEVTKAYEESTVSRILALVEDSASNKARSEQFITRFARWYTPVVVGCALLLAVLPPLLLGLPWKIWIHRALIFLVVSCPCAVVISVPLTFFSGIGCASKRGVLVKGANYLEALAQAETLVFDKTGTLTQGKFRVTEIHPRDIPAEDLLELAALGEQFSTHPIALSLRAALEREPDPARVTAVEELSGHGVKAEIDGRTVLIGNQKLMERFHIPWAADDCTGTLVHVAAEGAYLGHIRIADQLKPDAVQALADLRALGVKNLVMLTGDRADAAREVGEVLGLDQIHSELLPQDKVERVEALLTQKDSGKLLFVGDGLNDAPVLARADVGVAMGAFGSDAAIEAADVVLMDDQLAKLPLAIRISQQTRRIVKQNIAFALGVKAAVLLLGALGVATLWEAVFADVGVCVLAILNAMRALRFHQ